jgi:hypothetical protein
MNTQHRIEVEREIVAFLFNTMSQHGWHVDYIFAGGDNVRRAEWTEAAALDTVFSADESLISFVKATGCRGRIRRNVYIVLGNSGWDCINDHAGSNPNILEDDFEVVMKLVDTFAEQFESDPFAPKPPAGYTAEELERDNPYNQWMKDVET